MCKDNKYDKEVAERLVQDMTTFEGRTLEELQMTLLTVIQNQTWHDQKYAQFCQAMEAVRGDVKNSTNVIREYKSHLKDKIHGMDG